MGDRLKNLRESHGLLQQDVCRKLSVEQSTLANYESNRRVPKADILVAFADFYDVTLDYLFGRPEKKKSAVNLAADEKSLLEMYRLLNDFDKGRVHGYVERAFETSQKKRKGA